MKDEYGTDELTELYQKSREKVKDFLKTTKGKIITGIGAVAIGLSVYEGMTDIDTPEKYELDINGDGRADTRIVKKDGYSPGNGYFFGNKVELYMENSEGEMEEIGENTPYTGRFYTEPGKGRIVAEIAQNSFSEITEQKRYVSIELEDVLGKEHEDKESSYTETSKELGPDLEELPYDEVILTDID